MYNKNEGKRIFTLFFILLKDLCIFKAMKSGIFREIADSEKQGRIKYVRGSEFYNTMNSLVRQGDHVIIAQDKYGAVLKSQDFARTGISLSLRHCLNLHLAAI